MENWRNRSPTPAKPGKSSDSMANFQHHGNSYTSSLSSLNSSSNLHRERRCPFSELVDLIELSSQDSSKIILELIVNRQSFANFLESNLESDWIVMTITMLSKVCSTFFREIKRDLLKTSANAQFLQTLENFLRNLQYEAEQNQDENEHFWNNPEEFLGNLLFVCETIIIDVIPTEIVGNLQKLFKVVDYIVPSLSQKGNINVSRKTKKNIKVLRKKLDLLKKQSESENGADESSKAAINTFRRLSACFTREELSAWISEFTITDIVEGRYTFVNVEHYLEVQSRLIIKDFMVSLQEEIDKCFEHSKSSSSLPKSSPIRIYPDVVFRSMVFIYNEAGMIMNFSNQDEIFSKRSKCFKWGSILCFTKDNFASVFIGRVIKKDDKQRHLIVGFENDNSYVLNGLYTLAEFNISFQYCYTGLKALQCISEADFPMERYLIDAVSTAERPNYLDPNSSVYTIGGKEVDVFGNNWPTANQLQLDTTQYTAFKAALTQKFVMIQGAPGTGKTYLGLKIVKTLLHNDNPKIWYNETPILIVCLSNQVLDTFLEGLIPTTRRIIIVGKTNSEKLTNFTLKSVRARTYADRRLVYDFEKENITGLKLKLKNYNKCLNQIIDFNNIILHFKVFESIDDKLKTSWFSSAAEEDHFSWLFYEKNEDVHSLKISEVIKQITDEKKHIASQNNNTRLNRNSLPYNKILFSKLDNWFEIVKICNKMQEVDTPKNEMEKLELETQLKHLWRNYQYFKMKMIHRAFPPALTAPIHVNYHSPHSMDPNDRWNLYFSWLNLYKQYVEKKFLQLRCELREQSDISTEMQNILDLEAIKDSLVLGMTFHTAARLRTTLQSLKCRIAVVLEASGTLESSIMLSLTKHCKHLILMGNPPMIDSISVDNSNKFLNAGSSIMERMLKIKVQCNTLGFQHRMRPEISQLLAPYFYLKMKNHHSVTNFPKILGIPSCIFFVNQKHQPDVEEFNSKTNSHESKYLINLARYLRQVGYAPEDITILASFSGQMHALGDEMEKYQDLLLKDIKINIVDSYQGEECKIILLSLVRNNQDGKIGCMKSERFINLALSRATEALYMIGNIDLLSQNSEVWAKINEVLVEQNCVKNYLPVCCKINPNHVTKIIQPEDFDQVPEEVCSKICGCLLNCGHACSKQCHSMDGDHTSLSCTKLCKM